ncbi:HAMP domain-containing protein [Pontibacillus yanchengensis]|uniref:HAMP domain-containing protein n=2 Tax=Pontibacillus yanchengensis TaxID=462910 RepID=A0ACC7VDI1_9BACI|nr:sensor histidine kinase [Pontibacillus yanchengensis]MYL32167.1 HAMP domain-containing protein [Pontibacillus yanchengensis]MYL52747.1 HAMP domain-containing protein [Pontibacillus yanchengensis]
MKSSLKTRLVLAFLSTIIVPILVAILTLYLGADQLSSEEDDQLDQLFSDVKKEIRMTKDELPDRNAFYNEIKPLLDRYDMNVTIHTEKEELIFDSKNYREVDEMNSFLPNFNTFTIQVQPETGVMWDVTIQANSSQNAPFQRMNHIVRILLLSVGMGFLTMILMIVIWTTYISRTVLTPLKHIYQATEEMRDGNLDYPIVYKRKDEIGRFIEGFNVMRQHVKDSFKKQKQYEDSRKELIASISHDLRTPLSSIKGYVEGLRDGIVQNEEMKHRYLEVIHDKTDHLDHLIEDLFEFSKMEVDQLPIEKEVVNASVYFERLITKHQFELRNQAVELTYTNEVKPASILLDPIRVEQVMSNLIDNAVRYGSDRIKMDVHADDLEGTIAISITDNGQGIRKEDIPYIFTSFYRGEKSRSTYSGGSGLGLSIVKYIVKAHGGDIRVKSDKGKGSTFIFTLPLYVKGSNPSIFE